MSEFLALPSSINIMVSGQTQSGKTYFTSKLLMQCDHMFKEPPKMILYYFKHWQPLYDKMEQTLEGRIRFKDSLPSERELLNELAEIRQMYPEQKCHFIVCFDDWMDQMYKNPLFVDLTTRLAHHHRISNIFLVQDSSVTGQNKKELHSNIHANVFMASCRDRASLRQLAILLSDYACIMQSYDECAKQGRGSYLMIVTHPLADPNLKYRTKIFPGDKGGPIIFKSKKD